MTPRDTAESGAMAPLHWDRLKWPEFVAKLEGYRENYSKQGREDPAYLRCLRIMRERPMAQRAVRTRDIVLFLNTWSCHLPREVSVQVLSRWIREHLEQLERLAGVRIVDDDFLERLPEMLELYNSVLELKAEVRTMGDTAASKFVHMLLPEAIVMWDNNIKPFASGYRDFLTEMHHLARRLQQESGQPPDYVEEYLQRHLGYGVPKTMAKHLDEYNWYVAVGEK
jgi:hypothetical protein